MTPFFYKFDKFPDLARPFPDNEEDFDNE